VVIQLLKQLFQPNKQTNPFVQRKFIEDHVIQGKTLSVECSEKQGHRL